MKGCSFFSVYTNNNQILFPTRLGSFFSVSQKRKIKNMILEFPIYNALLFPFCFEI